jgi:hypothetical protein
MHPPAHSKPSLTLIEGRANESAFGLSPANRPTRAGPFTQRALTRRPGDRLESWCFERGTLRKIQEAAHAQGVDLDTAVALVVERRISLDDIAKAGFGDLETALNLRARDAQPEMELWSAHHDYLRYLLRGESADHGSVEPTRVAMPIRLIDRLAHREVFATGAPNGDELRNAIEWEIAALRSGESISEWAFRNALLELAQGTH